jgi:hypothetical protein
MNRIKAKQVAQNEGDGGAYKTASYFNVRKSEQSPFLKGKIVDEKCDTISTTRKKRVLH